MEREGPISPSGEFCIIFKTTIIQPAIAFQCGFPKQYKGNHTLAPDFVLTIWVENENYRAQATRQTSLS